MTAKKGPDGVKVGDQFLLPSGKLITVLEWLPNTEGWHCREFGASSKAKPVDELYSYHSHKFLLKYGERQ